MGDDVRTQIECWQTYEAFLQDSRVQFLADVEGISTALRRHSSSDQVAPKRWSDDILVAFADVYQVKIVTFDRALAARVEGSVLLTA